jgi:hypothetical protein
MALDNSVKLRTLMLKYYSGKALSMDNKDFVNLKERFQDFGYRCYRIHHCVGKFFA